MELHTSKFTPTKEWKKDVLKKAIASIEYQSTNGEKFNDEILILAIGEGEQSTSNNAHIVCPIPTFMKDGQKIFESDDERICFIYSTLKKQFNKPSAGLIEWTKILIRMRKNAETEFEILEDIDKVCHLIDPSKFWRQE